MPKANSGPDSVLNSENEFKFRISSDYFDYSEIIPVLLTMTVGVVAAVLKVSDDVIPFCAKLKITFEH